MSSKKLLMLAATTVAIAGLNASVFAGGPTTEMPVAAAPSDTGFTLGMQFNNYIASLFAATVGYVNPDFLVDIGGSYSNVNFGAFTQTVTYLVSDLGLRHLLMQSLYFTYGVVGSVGIRNQTQRGTTTPWTAGAFFGLDYQPMSNFLVSFKILPYNYVQRFVNTANTNSVFANGSIGASYVFAE